MKHPGKTLFAVGKLGPWARVLIAYVHIASGAKYSTTLQDSGRPVSKERANG